MPQFHVSIDGMTCGKCVAHVEKALDGLSEVASYEVDLSADSATVDLTEADESTRQKVLDALDEAGYPATEKKKRS